MILPRPGAAPIVLSPSTPWCPPLAQLTAEIQWEELILVASTERLPQVENPTRVLTFCDTATATKRIRLLNSSWRAPSPTTARVNSEPPAGSETTLLASGHASHAPPPPSPSGEALLGAVEDAIPDGDCDRRVWRGCMHACLHRACRFTPMHTRMHACRAAMITHHQAVASHQVLWLQQKIERQVCAHGAARRGMVHARTCGRAHARARQLENERKRATLVWVDKSENAAADGIYRGVCACRHPSLTMALPRCRAAPHVHASANTMHTRTHTRTRANARRCGDA